MSKHHKAAFGFLWTFWKIACITVGSVVGGLAALVALCMALDATPIPVRVVMGIVLGVGALYWAGYKLSQEQEENEERNAAFVNAFRAADPKELF